MALAEPSNTATPQRFATLFELNLWQPFLDAGMPADQAPALAAELARLGPLAERIVTTTLRHAMTSTAATFLDRQAAALTNQKAPAQTKQPKTKRN